MPMPHRTFAQVAKRRLVGKGRPGADPRGPRAARRAARLQERSVRGPPQVAAGGDRGHPRPLERRPPRLDRRPARGRGPDRPRRAAERRQVVAPPGAVRDPDQDRRLPVHDAPAGPGADPDRRRARPARRDPGADRGRHRGPRRRPGAARRAPLRRRDRLLRPSRRRPRASSATVLAEVAAAGIEKPAFLAATRADEADPGAIERPGGGVPGPGGRPGSVLDEASLDAFRDAVWRLTGLIRVRLRTNGVDRRGAARARSAGDGRGRRRLRSTTTWPRRSPAPGSGGRRRGSTASASAATTSSRTATSWRCSPDRR